MAAAGVRQQLRRLAALKAGGPYDTGAGGGRAGQGSDEELLGLVEGWCGEGGDAAEGEGGVR